MGTTPFDYTTIKTYKDACEKLGKHSTKNPDLTFAPRKHRKSIKAYFRLIIIFEAINDGWKPDWSDENETKYFAWFGVLPSGFGFSYSDNSTTGTGTTVGSRLCTNDYDKLYYMMGQFEGEFRDYLLYSE